MIPPDGRRELLRLFSILYFGIGVCSLAAGFYLLYLNKLDHKTIFTSAGPIGLFLIAFGPIRMVLSVRTLARLRPRGSSSANK